MGSKAWSVKLVVAESTVSYVPGFFSLRSLRRFSSLIFPLDLASIKLWTIRGQLRVDDLESAERSI